MATATRVYAELLDVMIFDGRAATNMEALKQDRLSKGQLRSQHLRVDKKLKLVLMPRSPRQEHQPLE